MRRAATGLVACGLIAAAATAAAASGAWETYIRPAGFTDIAAGADSVWFATANAGLVLYERATGAVSVFHRDFGGLAGNEISSLALDRSQRLWVGTLGGGLSRLTSDGRWRLVNQFDGLPSDSVTVVKAYGDSLWIGTPEGVAFWNGREISGRLPDGVNPSPFLSDRITGVVMLGDSVWVATAEGVYLGRMSGGLQFWTAVNTGLPTGQVDALVASGSRLFAQSLSLVWSLGPTGWALMNGTGLVYGLNEERGVVLAATSNGVLRWSGSAWVVVDGLPVSTGAIGDVAVTAADPAGTLFSAIQDSLYLPAPGGGWAPITLGGPIDNNLVNVFFDSKGLFLTTRTSGMSSLRSGLWRSFGRGSLSFPAPPDQPFFLSDIFAGFTDRRGRKWIAAWSHALEVLDDSGPAETWQHKWFNQTSDSTRHTWGWSSAVDSSGGVWVGSDSPCIDCPADQPAPPFGLDYYDSTGTWVRTYAHTTSASNTLISDQVRALAVDHTGRMWVGCALFGGDGGVNSFEIPLVQSGVALTFTRRLPLEAGTAASDVFGVETYGDSVWVLSSDALRLFLSDTLFATYDHLGPIAAPGSVHPLEITSDGSVWIANDGGMRRVHPGGTIEDFTTANSPLASNTVRTIRHQPGSDVLWIATTGGLNRYDPDYRPPPPVHVTQLTFRVYPNPIQLNGLGFSLAVTGDASAYAGAIFSIDGRRVRDIPVAANGEVVWDGRDGTGELVRPGVYLIRLEADGHAATKRVVVLR